PMAGPTKQATLRSLSGSPPMTKSIALLCVAVLLSACGQTGPLYLPDKGPPKKHAKNPPMKVVPTAEPEAAPGTPDAAAPAADAPKDSGSPPPAAPAPATRPDAAPDTPATPQ
ncbi:MAG: LPS translocon maturation chaperone LptM, partial [Solimonas sp.]